MILTEILDYEQLALGPTPLYIHGRTRLDGEESRSNDRGDNEDDTQDTSPVTVIDTAPLSRGHSHWLARM